MSGANSTPLGRMNPAIGAGKKQNGSSLLNPSYLEIMGSGIKTSSISSNTAAMKRESEGENSSDSDLSAAERKRRRKSRWQGSEKEKTFIPGMPTVLPSNMNKDQEEAYLLQLQIEELSRRLRSNDLGIPPNPEDRSPSPEPIYNNEGKRLNTREYRTRKKLEDDRHAIIQKMFKLNPEYKPPADYKPPVVKVSDKVMIPQEEHPDINFVGLLIGPRGNTLKSMEKDTGAKIIIRGKGSVKEGKVGRKDGGPMPGEDEPLHAYVTASNPESVKKAVDKIKEIIRQGVEVPEGQNDLRRMQLRELALLNGTLRENDSPRCSNCGSNLHKSWQCPDKPNVTNNVVCSSCGGAGHIAKDCRQRKPGQPPTQGVDRQKIDEEYMSLMAELGEGPPPPQNKNNGNNGNSRMQGGGGGGGGGGPPAIRSLFDTPVGPPRAIIGPPPPGSQGNQPNRANMNPNMNMGAMPNGMGMNNMGNMNMQMNNPNNNINNPNNMNMRNQPNNSNWSGNPNQQFNQRTNRPIIGGNNQNQQPNFNRPPPMNWQNQGQPGGMNQNQNAQGFQSGPPPNLLSAPPPPPPPTTSNQQGSQQQQQQQQSQQQQQQQWMNQGPNHGPPPGMNSWQGGPPAGGPHGPPGMGGCPPPGPVPPPRPVGPPPGWGWNGPPQPVGPPPPPPGGPGGNPNNGPRGPSGVDLGALLSAPPPPPPS